MAINFKNSEIALQIDKRRCPHCDSSIATVGCEGSIECGICDFADGTMTVFDAISAVSIRLFESICRVEIVLEHF